MTNKSYDKNIGRWLSKPFGEMAPTQLLDCLAPQKKKIIYIYIYILKATRLSYILCPL